jgi:hypothetical protein
MSKSPVRIPGGLHLPVHESRHIRISAIFRPKAFDRLLKAEQIILEIKSVEALLPYIRRND